MSPSQIASILEAIAAQNEHRMQMAADIKELSDTLGDFKTQYLHDMRGEGKINGYRGLIGEVQFVKDEIIKHPSIARVIATDPAKAFTVGGGLFVAALTLWFGLHQIASLPGVAAWFNKLLGLP